MKILSIVTQLESGGAQTVAVEIHRELVRRGVNSKLVFLYGKDNSAFPLKDYECVLDRRIRNASEYVFIISKLRSMWASFAPDVVLAHTHFSNNICGMLKATGLKGNVLPVHHCVYESYPAACRIADSIARVLGVYSREISVSDEVTKSLGRVAGRGNVATIPNGISLRASAFAKGEARAAFSLPNDAFIVGNVGRLSEQKNQGFLIELLPYLPEVHLAILGEGHLRERLEAQARGLGVADRCHLLGTVVHERVPDFLRCLDVFAMPSLFEGLSIAMLEAYAAQVPFIGNDVPTIADVAKGGAGIVHALNVTDWVSSVDKMRRDPAYAKEISERQWVRSGDFTLNSMVDRYLEVARA